MNQTTKQTRQTPPKEGLLKMRRIPTLVMQNRWGGEACRSFPQCCLTGAGPWMSRLYPIQSIHEIVMFVTSSIHVHFQIMQREPWFFFPLFWLGGGWITFFLAMYSKHQSYQNLVGRDWEKGKPLAYESASFGFHVCLWPRVVDSNAFLVRQKGLKIILGT